VCSLRFLCGVVILTTAVLAKKGDDDDEKRFYYPSEVRTLSLSLLKNILKRIRTITTALDADREASDLICKCG